MKLQSSLLEVVGKVDWGCLDLERILVMRMNSIVHQHSTQCNLSYVFYIT